MSLATATYGSVLQVGNGASPEVFTSIAEIVSLGELGPETTDIEVSHLTSPDAYREYLAGMIEPGECSFTANYIHQSATQGLATGLGFRQKQRVVYNWRIAISGISPEEGLAFSGYVKAWKPQFGGVDDKLMISGAIKVTGPITEF